MKDYPYEFEINSSLQLASIDGIQVATNDTITIPKEEYDKLKNANKYSEDEIIIGTWTNGKTLYRKVIAFENLTYDGNIFVGSLELQNVESYCRAEVYHLYGGPGFESYRSTSSSYFLDWYISGDKVYINNKIGNIKNYDYTVIVEYTKTTD